ncbi:hypothetical protein [Siphonobacter sp. SORGH_AS_0500]|uniref:hypothetical protein n=1 Tax=Siphonobacter sp. SORGH_AS_0500 TaxID=1864824 RepID=UPI00286BD882|nr:hypothetical protein [Siphonobacter sp. SORGH_AS_0500]
MLKDTTVALVKMRVEQPGKLAVAEKKGRKEGFKSGVKLGLFIPPALFGTIKLLPILFK